MTADPSPGAASDPGHPHAETPPDGAADPLAAFGHHWSAAWSSLRLYAAIVTDEAVDGVYRFAIECALALTILCSIILLMTFAGYFLVSGLALGLAELVGSPWLGRVLSGLLFLAIPLASGLILVAVLRRKRARRLLDVYRARQAKAGCP